MAWWEGKKEEEGKKEDELELKPKEVKAQLDKIETISTEFQKFRDESKSSQERLNKFLEAQEELQRIADEKAEAERNKRSGQEINDELESDPASAITKLISPMHQTALKTEAKLARKEFFEDNAKDFEYYSDPTFRRRVDALIESLPIQTQSNVKSIENCYAVAERELRQEIKDGKIKSKFAAQSSTNNNGSTKTNEVTGDNLSDDEKSVAAKFGMTNDEYAKAKKELSYV